MKRNNGRGFTLVEITVVLAIILTLAALFAPALNLTRRRARISQARAMVGSFEVAINMFFTDQGNFPNDLAILLNVTNGLGPYMDNRDFDGTNFTDPWARPYQYSSPGTNNPQSFDVSSTGPDGQDGTADDIGNW